MWHHQIKNFKGNFKAVVCYPTSGDWVYPGMVIGKNIMKLDAFMIMYLPKQSKLMVDLTNNNRWKSKHSFTTKDEKKIALFYMNLLILYTKTYFSNTLFYQVYWRYAPNDLILLLWLPWDKNNNIQLEYIRAAKLWITGVSGHQFQVLQESIQFSRKAELFNNAKTIHCGGGNLLTILCMNTMKTETYSFHHWKSSMLMNLYLAHIVNKEIGLT